MEYSSSGMILALLGIQIQKFTFNGPHIGSLVLDFFQNLQKIVRQYEDFSFVSLC